MWITTGIFRKHSTWAPPNSRNKEYLLVLKIPIKIPIMRERTAETVESCKVLTIPHNRASRYSKTTDQWNSMVFFAPYFPQSPASESVSARDSTQYPLFLLRDIRLMGSPDVALLPRLAARTERRRGTARLNLAGRSPPRRGSKHPLGNEEIWVGILAKVFPVDLMIPSGVPQIVDDKINRVFPLRVILPEHNAY